MQKPPIESSLAHPGTRRHEMAISCRGCALSQICLPGRLPAQEVHFLEQAVERDRVLPAGAALIHAGRRMQALYVISRGSAKGYCLSTEGDERVRGFYLPGELIGLESFAKRCHPSEVVALEPVRYCRIPVQRFELLMDILPGLRREIVRLMSQSLEEARRLRACLAVTDASARLAGFLLDLSRRLERRGLSSSEFDLSMSRRDIARHLGLTIETISRGLSAFKRAGWLSVQMRHIRIMDSQALVALSASA